MKIFLKSLLLFCIGLSSIGLSGQTYGNEWIDYTKTYYKIKLKEDQFYRLDYNALAAANVPLNPAGLKMMHKGEEIPMYVSSANANNMQPGDYIEFYGKKNDGTFDTQLFEEPEWQITDLNSLFTDTAAYFLVFDSSEPSLRYTDAANDLNTAPPVDEFFTYTHRRILDQAFFNGEPTTRELAGVDSYSSNFGNSEGFVSSVILPGEDKSYVVPLTGIYDNGGTMKIETKIIGRSNDLYYVAGDHHVRIRFDDVLYIDEQYEGYETAFYDFDVPVQNLEGSGVVNVQSVGDIWNTEQTTASVDRNSVGYIFATYPRSFDFGGSVSLNFELSNEESHYIEIENFNGGSNPVLYDLTNNLRFIPVVENGVYKVHLPQVVNGPDIRELFITATTGSAISSISELEGVQFTNFNSPGLASDYIILTHPKLMEPFNGVDQVQRYKDYRASVAGGSYTPLVVDVTELYDQFSYGIQQHPLAIRNFSNFIVDNYTTGNWSIKPDFLFLLGKSIRYHHCTNSPIEFQNNLVPTFGASGSDILLSARNIFTYQYQLATGRVSAKSPEEVKEYLDKIVEYELVLNGDYPCTIEDRKWLKDIIHIAAGQNSIEEATFTGHLNVYKKTVEDVKVGGNVLATLAGSSSTVTFAPVEEFINNGLSMITFVGHSNGQFWQYGLEAPEFYDNEGKYPFILSSSCFVGDIHKPFPPSNTDPIMAERFSLAPNRGAIGFLASVKFGFPSYLHEYTNALYDNFSGPLYGEPIGLSLRKTVSDIDTSGAIGTQITIEEFTLSGDPAVELYHFDNPEYLIAQENVAFVPSIISAGVESAEMHVTVVNVGKAVQDSIDITVEQTFPNGALGNSVTVTVPSPASEETYIINVPLTTIELQEPIGINNFNVTVDSDNALIEDCEDNNSIVKSQLILPTSAYPIDPCDFAIVGKQGITLRAATSVPVIENGSYIFEFDTTALFDSPFKKEHLSESVGGVIEWNLEEEDFFFNPQTVYYWRVAAVPEPGQNFSWNNSSFIYINGGKPGWNQSHYYQFATDEFENCSINEATREFEFESFEGLLTCQTTFLNNAADALIPSYSKNGSTQTVSSCLFEGGQTDCRGGIHVVVLEPGTFEPWYSVQVDPGILPNEEGTNCDEFGQFGNIHCTSAQKPVFQFHISSEGEIDNLMGLLDSIPVGYYVLLYSINDHNVNGVAELETALEPVEAFFDGMGLGAEYQNLEYNTTFVAFGRKGVASYGQKEMIYTDDQTEILELEKNIGLNSNGGRISTTRIGPALKWEELRWLSEPLIEGETTDDISIEVYGITHDNQSFLVLNTEEVTEHDLTPINAEQYPYLVMKAVMSDSINLTAPQLQHWRILYKRAPELIFNQSEFYRFYDDTLQAGDIGIFEMAVTNLSDTISQDILVAFITINEQNQADTTYQTYPAIEGYGTENILYEFETGHLSGDNFLQIILNPDRAQPEKLAFNNILILPFYVRADNVNPILDITFDGVHIQDGDIVSANPEILINLDDENPYLPLDPNGLEVYLTYPDGTQELIDLDGDIVQVVFPDAAAVAAGNNQLEIIVNPNFLQDGTYQLQVTGQDGAGNFAGIFDYQVSFEVILEAMITNVINYPNPFTTSTKFIFTLTGSEVPENFKIQIMTVKGTVVRELTTAELGAIHIGKNITEYAWDGTDMFGNELANGVYFYRVVASQNGEELELFTNSEDGKYNMSSTSKMDETFGKHGIGKMYKIR